MKKAQKLIVFLLAFSSLTLFFPSAQAATTSLSLSTVSGDSVQVSVSGEANTTIQLSFWPTGATTVTTLTFGTTNASGNFSTSISSGGYGIPAGSPTYATINGVQSAMQLWPSYSSSLTVNKSDIQIAVGQSLTIGASSAIILAANSLPSSVSTLVSGSQLTVTGLKAGTATLALCGANAGCISLPIIVGSNGQTQVSFQQNNIVLTSGTSQNITIFGSSRNGYFISSNSNPNVVDASISANSDTLSLFGKHVEGSTTITVCSYESSSNCASLSLTVVKSSSNVLSFNKNDLSLVPGLNQAITVSGGPDSNYYISSNSNSGIASASLSGNTLTVIGGSSTGSTVIKVCSTSLNATCGNLNVYNNADTITPTATTLSFSQNVVSITKGLSSNVTVAGGTGTGYTVSSNSNPTVATASITGSSNVINIYGNEVGSAIISICSASSSATCASIYVNVTSALLQITFSQNNINLTAGQKSIISITGEAGAKTISSNSNSGVATATLNNDGNILLIMPGSVSGSTTITICSSANTNNCGSIVANNKTITTSTPKTETPSTPAVATVDLAKQILEDVYALMAGSGIVKDGVLEDKILASLTMPLLSGVKNFSSANKITLNNFITYGTTTTKKIGDKERAGVVGSYKRAFGKLPKTQNEWLDVVKIANGQWPAATNANALKSAKAEFAKVYKRQANMLNKKDNTAIAYIAYGIRPAVKNNTAEAAAIKTFKKVYAHNPISSLAWDIVRAIAYSGAAR